MADLAAPVSKDGPGRLAAGEGGVPKLAGKSAFTPEAGLADLSTVDDPRPQKPEPDAPAGEPLADPADPSDLARSDGGDGGGSAAASSAALLQSVRASDAVEARPVSSSSPPATAPVSSIIDTPGGVAQSGAGSQPVGSVEVAGASPPEPLNVLQAQVQVLTEQIQELRTALSEAGAGPALRARDGAQPVDLSSAPLAAEAPAGRLEDTAGPGADAPAQAATSLSGLVQGVEPSIGEAAAVPATALGPVTDVISAAADAAGASLPASVIGPTTAGAVELLTGTAGIGAPSNVVQDGAEVLDGVVTPVVDLPAASPLGTATDLIADAVDPPATDQLLPATEPVTDLLAEVAETAVDDPASALDVADDLVEQPASTIEAVPPPPPTTLIEALGSAPVAPPPALDAPPSEPPAPTIETLLANVGAGIVAPGLVSDPKPPPSAEPKPSPAEDDEEGDPMAGTGLADDPADADSPADWLGGLSGALGGSPGAAPPPPDPFDPFGL